MKAPPRKVPFLKNWGLYVMLWLGLHIYLVYLFVALSVLAAGYGLGRTALMFFDFLWGG